MIDESSLDWRKARCGASNTCVEVARWRIASRCGANTGCVEVGAGSTAVLVRDSTDPDGPRLALSRAAFGGLLASIREGRHE